MHKEEQVYTQQKQELDEELLELLFIDTILKEISDANLETKEQLEKEKIYDE